MSCESGSKTQRDNDIEPIGFIEAMGNVPGAVAVAAAGLRGSRSGLTVTAWCCLSITPPTLLVCVNRATKSCEAITAKGTFSLSQLSVSQAALASEFAGEGGLVGEEKFTHGSGKWDAFATGTPALRAAVGSYDCRVVEIYEQHTHCIIVGRVIEARARNLVKPLVYLQRQFHQTKAMKQQARNENRRYDARKVGSDNNQNRCSNRSM